MNDVQSKKTGIQITITKEEDTSCCPVCGHLIDQATWADLAKAGTAVALVEARVTYNEEDEAYDCDPWTEAAIEALSQKGASEEDLDAMVSVAFDGEKHFTKEELATLPDYGEGAYCLNCKASL